VKFFVDMPLPPHLAQWLVEHGHDAVHALEIGLDRAPDSEILRLARAEARAVITADLDYPRLLALARAAEPSLILFRGGAWSNAAVISRMGTLLESVSDSEFAHSVFVVDPDRIRRRRLPLR
jgi:predicted nuclease of predicted toxin-antitoxin system